MEGVDDDIGEGVDTEEIAVIVNPGKKEDALMEVAGDCFLETLDESGFPRRKLMILEEYDGTVGIGLQNTGDSDIEIGM